MSDKSSEYDQNVRFDEGNMAPDVNKRADAFGENDNGDGSFEKDGQTGKWPELETALAYFCSGVVGAVDSYAAPLSRQHRKDIAIQFPADNKYFDFAEKTQWSVIRGYLYLRIATFTLFFVLTIFQTLAFYMSISTNATVDGAGFVFNVFGYSLPIVKPVLSLISAGQSLPGGVIPIVMVASGLFIFLRYLVRKVGFYILGIRAERLSFDIFTRLDEVSSRVTETCAKARDRVGDGEWPERARHWTIIALWNARRAEYLDRYITIIIWTVRTYILTIERVFILLKIAVMVAGFFWLFQQISGSGVGNQVKVGVFSFFLGLQTYLLWHRAGMRPNDFWTEQFRRSASDTAGIRETYVDKISVLVENLVDEVISKEFGNGRSEKQ